MKHTFGKWGQRRGQRATLGSIIVLTMVMAMGLSASAVDLTLWVNCWQQDAMDAIQHAADVFAERHPEVNSVIVHAPGCAGEHFEQLTVHVIGGTPPDVATMAAPFAQHALAGLLQPLNQFIDKSTVIERDDYSSFMLNAFAYDGVEYGVPAIEAALGLVFIYNKHLFAEAGLPDRGPDTLDDVVELHTRLTRLTPDGDRLLQVGLDPMNAMGGHYFPLIWGTVFDVDWYDEESRTLNFPAFADSLDWMKRIYDVPGIAYIQDAGFGGWASAMASGRVGMQVNGSFVPGELAQMDMVIDEMGYTWMPSSIGDKATASSPWGMGIPIGVSRPDLSFELIEFFTTDEALQIVFDATGWLNGNLASIQQLDISVAPEIAPIIGMIAEADRFMAPPPLPIITDVYNTMGGRVTEVMQGDIDGRIMLEQMQHEMQGRLDEFFSRID